MNQVIQYFLTNCFTFLTKFRIFKWENHVFVDFLPVLFYEWNRSINYSFRFCLFFPRNHFLERALLLNGGISFLNGGLPHGVHQLWWGMGSTKIIDCGGHSHASSFKGLKLKFCLRSGFGYMAQYLWQTASYHEIPNQVFQWIFCMWAINCSCKNVFSKIVRVIYCASQGFWVGCIIL